MPAAIVGARRPSQIEETAPAGHWVLSAEDIAPIDALLAERERALAQAQYGSVKGLELRLQPDFPA